SDPEAPNIQLSGTSNIGGVHVRLPEQNNLDTTIDETTLTGINVDLLKRSVRFESVSLSSPSLRLNALLLPSTASGESELSAESDLAIEPEATLDLTQRLAAYRHDSEMGYLLQIDQFTMTSGAVQITDDATEPPLTLTMDSIEVQASNIANDGATSTDLTITTNVQGTGRASLRGIVDPFQSASPYADVTVNLTGIPLKPYDPYAGYFLGYFIESGRATMNVPLQVELGMLDGSVDVDLSHFYLGEKTNSPAAPDAPIKFGLDLVRDTDDHIRAEIEFKGDLTDPNFKLGKVIWDEMLGLLVRGATAPFRLLASVFAGDENIDLSVLDFEPGSDQFTPEATDKIDILATALTERPTLRLMVVGRTAEDDLEPLRQRLFDKQLLEHLRLQDDTIRNLTPQRRSEAIVSLFGEVFPDHVVVPVPVPPGRIDQGLSPEVMETMLLGIVEVDDDTTNELATLRARRVIQFLTSDFAIAPERITLGQELTAPGNKHEGPRTDLELY
ncbi:MAG: DUF748 domain-containing protein, partial [Planctomycetota bacterium]|nr:DUF748 domain-containing protein [Planctomycetota bacterium]